MSPGARAALGSLALGVALLVAAEPSLAQNPFGGPRPPAEPQAAGLFGWLLAKQAEFYRAMSATIRAAKADGSAVWSLLAIAFAYGVFHAAGPGHGKAVIASYLVANEDTARRGVVLSFVSALTQSLVAIAIVGVGAWLLNASAKTMCSAERVIEIASYGLIALMGARLVWVKGRGFLRCLPMMSAPATSPVLAHAHAGASPAGHHHSHHHDRAHHGHAHPHDHHADAGDHVHDAHCGHSHGPTPAELSGPNGWRRGLGIALAAGLRPCSGAILVLVFALAQGLFWSGVAATFAMGLGTALTVAAIATVAVSAKGLAQRLAARAGGAATVLRGVELAAAALVLVFGVGLLLGYLAAERTTCL